MNLAIAKNSYELPHIVRHIFVIINKQLPVQ